MPRFSVAESQQLILGLLLGGVVPLVTALAVAALASGQATLFGRLFRAGRLAEVAVRWVVLPAVGLLAIVLVWAATDQSRAVNLTLIGAISGAIAALAFQGLAFVLNTAGWSPFNPVHFLGRLTAGLEAPAPTVRIAGWLALLGLGAAVGIGYSTMVGNFGWWYGLVAGLVVWLCLGLLPALLLGGGPLLPVRGVGGFLSHLLASAVYGLLLGVLVTSFAVTRGWLVATLALAGGGS